MALCDARHGDARRPRWCWTAPIADTSLDGLAEAMVGRRVQPGPRRRRAARTPGAVLLQAQRPAAGATRWACRGWTACRCTLRAGEIVGIAGVSGNGQSELLDVLSGMRAPRRRRAAAWATQHFDAGALARPAPRARAAAWPMCPKTATRRGLVLPFAAWESAVLGYQRGRATAARGWMRQRAMRAATARDDGTLRRAPAQRRRCAASQVLRRQPAEAGAGARGSAASRSVLLVGQPTRGVDIGAIEFIHGRLRAHARRRRRGAAGVVSELDEILALADRVMVMNAGRIAGELPIDACTEAALGRLMGGRAKARGR